MTQKMLIDADIIVYQAAASSEHIVEFDDDLHVLYSDAKEAKVILDERLSQFEEDTGIATDDMVFCFSDKKNFRKDILPSYKGNRKNTRKPIAYQPLKAFVEATYNCVSMPGLEGDDVIGILATDPSDNNDYIIWSIDKDLMQIPGKHWVMDEVSVIGEEEAHRFHMLQTLMGDTVDGYSGCPGIGVKRAEAILDISTDWQIVEDTYLAKGLTEREALIQARVARICRHEDYDFEKQEAKPWLPKPENPTTTTWDANTGSNGQ